MMELSKMVAFVPGYQHDVFISYAHVDNEPAENASRPIVPGRRNWLLVGSDKGGRTAADLSDSVPGCRCYKIDQFACLRDVRATFAASPINEIGQLLPVRKHPARTTEEA